MRKNRSVTSNGGLLCALFCIILVDIDVSTFMNISDIRDDDVVKLLVQTFRLVSDDGIQSAESAHHSCIITCSLCMQKHYLSFWLPKLQISIYFHADDKTSFC